MKDQVRIQQRGNELHVIANVPRMTYLNSVMRANCFPELFDLFRHAHAPPKEFTESYSALHHLRDWIKRFTWCQVIHVGDGAHARTAALFSFLTKNTDNFAVDPALNVNRVLEWQERFAVMRFRAYRDKIEDLIDVMPINWGCPVLVTFVHAHVDTDRVLNALPAWDFAFTMACCQQGKQLSSAHNIVKEGQDWAVLSEQRSYQVVRP